MKHYSHQPYRANKRAGQTSLYRRQLEFMALVWDVSCDELERQLRQRVAGSPRLRLAEARLPRTSRYYR